MGTSMSVESFWDTLRAHGLADGAGVPCSYFKPLLTHAATGSRDSSYVAATSEGEAVALAAGLCAKGGSAYALMQNSGLGNAVNPVTSLLNVYHIPVMLFVSLRGEPGRHDEPQHLTMGQITCELATLCGLRTSVFTPETFPAELAAAVEERVPSAWVVRKDAFAAISRRPDAMRSEEFVSRVTAPGNTGSFEARATREDMLGAMLPLLNGGCGGSLADAPAVVSTTGKLSRELYELDDRDHARDNRFYMVGSMGCAAGFGLGVARGAPTRRVVVLDGDGAILMKLGTLATAGRLAQGNFHHVIIDNGVYDSTGGQPTASPGVDMAAVAVACGYRDARTVDTPEGAAHALAQQLAAEGPTLLRAITLPGSRKGLGRPKLSPREGFMRFQGFLTAPVGREHR